MMVARTRRDVGLLVTLTRNDEFVENLTAPTGERALKGAMMILARLEELQVGDRIFVTEANEEAPR
jgi:hypothetical protein